MSTQHTYKSYVTLHLHDGDEYDFDLSIGFAFTPGEPARGPSYASGGEPASLDEVDVNSLRVSWSKPHKHRSDPAHLASALMLIVQEDAALLENMAESAREDDIAERDHHAELEADERRLGR